MKTETCKLYSRDFWIFLPNIIKIDHYNSELYCFKVCAFFETRCVFCFHSNICVKLLFWTSNEQSCALLPWSDCGGGLFAGVYMEWPSMKVIITLLFVVITYRRVSLWLWENLENSENFFSYFVAALFECPMQLSGVRSAKCSLPAANLVFNGKGGPRPVSQPSSDYSTSKPSFPGVKSKPASIMHYVLSCHRCMYFIYRVVQKRGILFKYVIVHNHREEITFFAQKHNLCTSEDKTT